MFYFFSEQTTIGAIDWGLVGGSSVHLRGRMCNDRMSLFLDGQKIGEVPAIVPTSTEIYRVESRMQV